MIIGFQYKYIGKRNNAKKPDNTESGLGTESHDDQGENVCKTKQKLENHTRTQNGIIASYKCDKCEKTFKHSATLYSHKKIVHEKIRYACDECDKRFTKRSILNMHTKTVHQSENKCICDI